MWLFIRRINKSTTRQDLNEFIDKGLGPAWLLGLRTKRATVKRCEIMRITDTTTGVDEYHGLVQIEPAKTAQSVIDRLSGGELKGKRVEVRKYYRRSSYRDRRLGEPEAPAGAERRQQDRRRQNIRLEVMNAPKVEGMMGFNRIYN